MIITLPYKVYVRIDQNGRIAEINSDAFLLSTDGWVYVDEGYGDRCHHAQVNYLPKPLYDDRGIHRYNLVDGAPVERTQEEMDTDWSIRPAPEPTTEELLLETAGDHEYRLCLMELGVNASDLQET